jgi:hypothetical protein
MFVLLILIGCHTPATFATNVGITRGTPAFYFIASIQKSILLPKRSRSLLFIREKRPVDIMNYKEPI